MTEAKRLEPGSFRDPSGFLFWQESQLYRQVNDSYRENLRSTPRLGALSSICGAEGSLIAHEECDRQLARTASAYKVIRPQRVPFVSYPYEWCFSQLKDAALLTLRIQKTALAHGMSLKDASAYNMQFVNGKPVLIDTLSFEKYLPGRPWVAYRQFCQHFLAPLALMARRDIRLSQLSRLYLDGVPLDLASRLLPAGTRFKFSLLSHIHLHARSQKHYEDKPVRSAQRQMSRFALLALINSLEAAVVRSALAAPRQRMGGLLRPYQLFRAGRRLQKKAGGRFPGQQLDPRHVWDIGANTGVFSRLACERGIPTVALDIDAAAVEKNYLPVPPGGDPLPAAAGGRHHQSQPGHRLGKRGKDVAAGARPGGRYPGPGPGAPPGHRQQPSLRQDRRAVLPPVPESLIIEFIPKSDSQVQRLLATREDVFPTYEAGSFEAEFSRFFDIAGSEKIPESQRTLYLMRRRPPEK